MPTRLPRRVQMPKPKPKANAEKASVDAQRSAAEGEAKAIAEEKARAKADAIARLNRPVKPSKTIQDLFHRARAPIAAAETTRITEMGEPPRDPDGKLNVDPFDTWDSHPLE
jgi:regulator of protease activity HflC (stomatin/prohibitin superfamily)